MTLLELALAGLAYLAGVAVLIRLVHLHHWRDPWELPPRDRTVDLTGRRLGR